MHHPCTNGFPAGTAASCLSRPGSHWQAQPTLARTFAAGAGPTLPSTLSQSHVALPPPLCFGMASEVPLASWGSAGCKEMYLFIFAYLVHEAEVQP